MHSTGGRASLSERRRELSGMPWALSQLQGRMVALFAAVLLVPVLPFFVLLVFVGEQRR
jgi:hypothetical protein